MGGGRDRVRPVQARALPTVVAAIEATVQLIEERGEAEVRLQDVVARSGVSNGSLMHHFGSRDGLIAAAHSTRSDRASLERLQMLDGLVDEADGFEPGLLRLVLDAGGEHRLRARRARLRALSFARHRPDLRAAIVASMRSSEEALATRLGAARPGLIVSGTSPAALAVFAETYAVGLLLDDAVLAPLPDGEWQALFLAALEAVLPRALLTRVREHLEVDATTPGAAPGGVPAGPPAGPAPEDPAPDVQRGASQPVVRLDTDEQRLVLHVAAILRAEGPAGVVVRDVCDAVGVSRGWFARHFTGRDEVIDLARMLSLGAAATSEATAYEAAFAAMADASDLDAVLTVALADVAGPESSADAWDRLDLLANATRDDPFARDAGVIVGAGLDRIASAVAAAQARGVLRADVSAPAIARFLWGARIAFLLGDIAGVPVEELRTFARRTGATFAAR